MIESFCGSMDGMVYASDRTRSRALALAPLPTLVQSVGPPRPRTARARLTQPTEDSERPWDETRKWELLAQVLVGKLSLRAACERHRIPEAELHEWLRGFQRSALAAFEEQLRLALIQNGAPAAALGGAELSLSLSDISMVDWIQAVQSFAEQAVITVLHDDTESRLWCERGALIDAESGSLSGDAAVYRIVNLEHGQVLTELRGVQRERTIRASTPALLLEAAHRKDESALLRQRLGDLERPFQSIEPGAPAQLLDAEAATLRLFEEPRRLCDAIEQSELGDVEMLAALEGLIRAGHLVETQPTPRSLPAVNVPAVNVPTVKVPALKVPTVKAQRSEATDRPTARRLPVAFVWQPERERRHGSLRWVASTVVMAIVASLSGWLGATLSRHGSSGAVLTAATPPATALLSERVPDTYPVVVRPYPPEASVDFDGRGVGVGYWATRLPRDGAVHEVRVSRTGFVPAKILFVDAAPPLDVRLDPLPLLLVPQPLGVEDPGARPLDVAARPASQQRAWPAPTRNKAAVRAAEPTSALTRSIKPASSSKKRPYVQIIEPEAPSARRD